MQEIMKANKMKKDTSFPALEIPTQSRRRTKTLTPSEGDPTTTKRPYTAGKEKDMVCPLAWDNLKLQVIVHILVGI
jgi:hypothetical protein